MGVHGLMTLLMERKEAAGRPVVLHELPRCGSAPPSVAVDALAFLHWLLAERDDTGAADTGACHGGALLGGEYADIDAALRRAIASLCYDGDIASSGPAGGSGGGGPASPALRLRLAFTMDAAPLTAAGAPRKLDTWTSRGKERRRNAANLSGILGGAAGQLGGRSMGSLPVTPEAELPRTQEMVLPVTQMRLPSASEDMPGPSEFCLVAASGPKDAAALPEAERVKLPKQLPRALQAEVPLPQLASWQLRATIRSVVQEAQERGIPSPVSFQVAFGEADELAAALVAGGEAVAVLSSDTDFAVMADCALLLLPLLDLREGEPPTGWLFTPDSVAAVLGVEAASLPDVAALCGNDITSHILEQTDLRRELGLPGNLRAAPMEAAAWVRCAMGMRLEHSKQARGRGTQLQEALTASRAFFELPHVPPPPPPLPEDLPGADNPGEVARVHDWLAEQMACGALPPFTLAVAANRQHWAPHRVGDQLHLQMELRQHRRLRQRMYALLGCGGAEVTERTPAASPRKRSQPARRLAVPAHFPELGGDGGTGKGQGMAIPCCWQLAGMPMGAARQLSLLLLGVAGLREDVACAPALAALLAADPLATGDAATATAAPLLRYLLHALAADTSEYRRKAMQHLADWELYALAASLAVTSSPPPLPPGLAGALGALEGRPPLRLVRAGVVLQSAAAAVADLLALTGVAGGRDSPAALYSGRVLARLYCAAARQAHARAEAPEAAETAPAMEAAVAVEAEISEATTAIEAAETPQTAAATEAALAGSAAGSLCAGWDWTFGELLQGEQGKAAAALLEAAAWGLPGGALPQAALLRGDAAKAAAEEVLRHCRSVELAGTPSPSPAPTATPIPAPIATPTPAPAPAPATPGSAPLPSATPPPKSAETGVGGSESPAAAQTTCRVLGFSPSPTFKPLSNPRRAALRSVPADPGKKARVLATATKVSATKELRHCLPVPLASSLPPAAAPTVPAATPPPATTPPPPGGALGRGGGDRGVSADPQKAALRSVLEALDKPELALRPPPPPRPEVPPAASSPPARRPPPPESSAALAGLAVWEHRGAIVERVWGPDGRLRGGALCIAGDTGCGKSTVVPLVLLREAQRRGQAGRVVVAQPRRLAAVSLARRVASQLGEPLGDTVGYAISRDAAASRGTRLLFVTTGYLLEKLSHDPGWLGGCLHIVLDEAHERSADMDLLAMLLRALKAGAAHRSGRPHLTVMSATLQAAVFARYFAAPPLAGTTGIGARVLEVPRGGGDEEAPLVVGGRRFPVAELCLDSLAAPTEESCDTLSAMGLLDAVRHPKVVQLAAALLRAGTGLGRPQLSDGAAALGAELGVRAGMAGHGVLLFAPGLAEIGALQAAVEAAACGAGVGDRVHGCVLHSLVPAEEQEAALAPPPEGCFKVVLATNVAESSITIPDIGVVIDFCLQRVSSYDEARAMPTLGLAWSSGASKAQRGGRAGRVAPGAALRIVTAAAAASHPPFDPSELLRASLDRPLLRMTAHMAHLGTPAQLLAATPQPPEATRVEAALAQLRATGCLTATGCVTALGHFAVSLPLSVALARLVFLGCLSAHCEADCLVMAAGLGLSPEPYALPHRPLARSAADFLAGVHASQGARARADAGLYSEPLGLRRLYAQWLEGPASRQWAAAQGCSHTRLRQFDSLVAELAVRVLAAAHRSRGKGGRGGRGGTAPGGGGGAEGSGSWALSAAQEGRLGWLAGRARGRRAASASAAAPPLFCADADLLRALLAASFAGGVMAGQREAPHPSLVQRLVQHAVGAPAVSRCVVGSGGEALVEFSEEGADGAGGGGESDLLGDLPGTAKLLVAAGNGRLFRLRLPNPAHPAPPGAAEAEEAEVNAGRLDWAGGLRWAALACGRPAAPGWRAPLFAAADNGRGGGAAPPRCGGYWAVAAGFVDVRESGALRAAAVSLLPSRGALGLMMVLASVPAPPELRVCVERRLMGESDGGRGGDGDGEGGGVRPLRVGGLMVGGRPLPLSPAWMGEEELAAVEGLRATIGAALLGSLPDPDALLQAIQRLQAGAERVAARPPLNNREQKGKHWRWLTLAPSGCRPGSPLSRASDDDDDSGGGDSSGRSSDWTTDDGSGCGADGAAPPPLLPPLGLASVASMARRQPL
eukprot:jgi/Tetstr1/466656/TSEL_011144.t1